MLFSASDLQRFFNQGEQGVASEHPFLIDRLSLPAVIGTNIYSLPDYVISIRRVTWLGTKLDPLPRRNERDVFQQAGQVGKPFWYVYNNIGVNNIKLFPSPASNIPYVSNVWDTDIPKGFIIEYFRMTDNSSFIIPATWRNTLLKRYSAHRAVLIDGKGINLKLSKYYHDQWQGWKQMFYAHLDELFSKPRKYVINEAANNNYFPASPILPVGRFGVGVDDGY